jgi:hypothetical protein
LVARRVYGLEVWIDPIYEEEVGFISGIVVIRVYARQGPRNSSGAGRSATVKRP